MSPKVEILENGKDNAIFFEAIIVERKSETNKLGECSAGQVCVFSPKAIEFDRFLQGNGQQKS